MPIASQEDYDKAQSLLTSGKAKDPTRLQLAMKRWERLAMPQAGALVEGVGDGSPLAKLQIQHPPTETRPNAAQQQGYNIDLSQPEVITSLANDPQRADKIAKIRELTRDASLQNASKLKVFADPPDYQPEADKNPFSSFATAAIRKYFYEPSVEEFKAALKQDGSLKKHLEKELSVIPNVEKALDKDIEESTTFKAYQDAAWRHAYADAVKNKTPLSRAKYSKEMGAIEGAQAKALDPAMAFANSALSGYTMGLSGPTETDEERRSVGRNPTASLVGEVAGSLSPRGALGGSLPLRVAEKTTKLLGKAGLGSRGLQGVAKGLAAGAATGGIDAGTRSISRSAVEALDAGDTAVEAAARIADAFPGDVAQGAGLGLAFGAGGEALGGLARTGARAIVKGQPRDILLRAQSSGMKMGPLGGGVDAPGLNEFSARAAAAGRTPENVIAEDLATPLSRQRLLEQEGMHRKALEDTRAARERLTVPQAPPAPPVEVNPLEVLPRPSRQEFEAHRQAVAKAAASVTPEEAEAVRRFSHGYDQSIRSLQRGADEAEVAAGHKRGADHVREARESIPRLQSYMEKMPPALEVPYVYRGIVVPEGELPGLLGVSTIHADPVGKVAVTSASADPIVARSFVARNLEPGTRGVVLKLKHQSAVGTGQFASPQMQVEKELLLPGDAEFRVVKRYKDSSTGQHIIEAEELPRGEPTLPQAKQVTVPTADAADRIDELRRGLSDIAGDTNKNELRSIANRLRQRGRLTAEQIDADIDALEAKASSTAGKPDKNILAVKKILLDLRDEFHFPGDEETAIDNFAIRDPEGNVKPVDGYSALKAKQEREMAIYETQNAAMGLPPRLGPAPVKIPASPRDAVSAMAESLPPEVDFPLNSRETFVRGIESSSDPKNAVKFGHYEALAKRAGLDEADSLQRLRQLRSRNEWKQYLGRAISGIGTGGGTYVKANNLLRTVPSLNSIAGGLPQFEASGKAMDVVDRFLAQSVPSWRLVHSRGGQAARPVGAIVGRDKKSPRDTLTDEEAQFAAAVIKNLLEMDK